MMTLGDMYELAVKMGIEADPRGVDGVKKLLARRKKEYEELSASKKKEVDLEDLTNPYTDSRIFLGDKKLKVDHLLAGIDINASEVLLADRLTLRLTRPLLPHAKKGRRLGSKSECHRPR